MPCAKQVIDVDPDVHIRVPTPGKCARGKLPTTAILTNSRMRAALRDGATAQGAEVFSLPRLEVRAAPRALRVRRAPLMWITLLMLPTVPCARAPRDLDPRIRPHLAPRKRTRGLRMPMLVRFAGTDRPSIAMWWGEHRKTSLRIRVGSTEPLHA